MLRAIEEKKIERVGGRKPFSVNVRILAATNQDLLGLVQKRLFREDLFFRVNVFRIVISPLRERKEDIVVLVKLIVEQLALQFEKRNSVLPGKVRGREIVS